jgi:Fic family protein
MLPLCLMALITNHLLEQYLKRQKFTLHKKMEDLDKRKAEIQPFAFIVSSVYSSLIEGSTVDVEKYLSYKSTKNKSTDMIQVQDLMKAYQFAKEHPLTKSNFLKVHAMLSKHFNVDAKYKGAVRDKNASIGTLAYTVYEGAHKDIVAQEFDTLFLDINKLKLKKHTHYEAFYYASYIHLMMLKVHPFADGNGRISRLLEKWFLATTVSSTAWLIPSELYYQTVKKVYYDNLAIGTAYNNINLDLSLDFLLMLPQSFKISKRKYIF